MVQTRRLNYHPPTSSIHVNSRANLSVHLHSKTCLVCFLSMSLFDCQRSIRRSVEISELNRTHMSHVTYRTYLNAQISTRSQVRGGGEGIRTPDPRVANAVLCQLSYAPNKQNLKFQIQDSRDWLRGRDLNPRPLGYEPNELPDCSTPRQSQLIQTTYI